MVTILPKENDWADAFRQLGGGLVEGYTNRSDEMALQKAVSSLPPNATPRDILNAITNTKTYRPAAKQEALKNYMGVAEFEQSQRKAQAVQEETQRKNQANEEIQRTRNEILQQKSNEKKPTALDAKLAQKHAEEIVDIEHKLPELEDNSRVLDEIEGILQERGTGLADVPGNLVAGVVGSQAATELEALAFPPLQAIIKMFNPSGPLAVRKLEILKDMYLIKATDLPWVAQGKLKALRTFNNQAIERMKNRQKVLMSGDENQLKKFDKDTETLMDVMLDYEIAGEEAQIEGLPDAAEFKGKTLRGPDGQKVYSDGTRWLTK